MPWMRRLAAACAVGAALAAGGGAALATSSLDIYTDYANDGVVDGRYSTADLRAALTSTRGDANYGAFADAVQDALDRRLLGARGSGPSGDGIVVSPAAPGSELPEPRKPDENEGPPWPFIALSGLGGALILTGAGSSIYRRTRR
jgi:hypothetical protein